MNADPLLPHVQALLSEQVDTVAQLELLLFMYHHRHRAWSAQETATEGRSSPEWARQQLALLAKRGLVHRTDHGYQYVPRPELDRAVTDLAQAYRVFPVTVIGAIYARRRPVDQNMQNFAEAFRLRRDSQGPGREGGSHG